MIFLLCEHSDGACPVTSESRRPPGRRHLSLPLLPADVTRRSFYQSVVYLSTSKLSVVVLANAALATALAFTAGLKAVFLGPLRTNEVGRAGKRGPCPGLMGL
jgi:hypothetical protein